MSSLQPVTPDFPTLALPFFRSAEELGEFDEVAATDMPELHRALLAHSYHMTRTLEQHHECRLDVRVLAKHTDDSHYSRKISLTRQSDDVVVLTGIMRLDLRCVSDTVRGEIEGESIPLGQILISHDVMREVELVSLYKITPGEHFRRQLEMKPGDVTFGRTAMIHVDGRPAVELLEIVAPS